MEGSKDSSYPSQESPWGLALTLTLLQGRQCPLLPSHPSRAQGQQKAHLLLLRGTETQWGPKAACPVPPWPSCTLPMQRQPTFPLTFPFFPALWRRANISVTFAGSPPGPSNTRSSHPPCSPATEAHEFLPLTVPESILCSRSRLCEGMLLWKHLRPHGLRCAY